MAGWIQHDLVPLHVDQGSRHDHAALIAVLRRGHLKLDGQLRDALGHVQLKGIDIQRITLPGQRLAIGAYHQTRQLIDGAARRMVARQPLRIQQSQRTGLDRQRLIDL